MRLIDADALIKTLETQDYSNAPNTLEKWTPQDLTNAEIFDINNAPTVDAVEVVRCEDCKWFEPEDEDGDCWCYCHNDITCRDCYCSWGERKKSIVLMEKGREDEPFD